MSKLTLAATALALAAGALGGAAYQKAALVQTQLHDLQAARAKPAQEGPSVEELESTVKRLEARIAILERRAPSAADPTAAAAPAPADPAAAATADPDSAAPAEKDAGRRSRYDLGALPKDPAQRDARKQMVSAVVAEHWKAWGAKYGLTDRQTSELAEMQSEAAKRRLDNQAKVTDGQLTLPDTRAANLEAAEEIRLKAKALLTAAQFAQFEADRGAEWGSSYQRIREAEAKEGAGTRN